MTLALTACNGDNGDNGDNSDDNGNGGDASSLPDLREEYGGDDWPTELQFVSIPSEDQVELAVQYEVLIEMFEEALDVTIESDEVTAYAAAIEALGAGTADIANFGPFSYVVAADTAGAQSVAVAVSEQDEEPSYVSYLVTLSDNDEINGIEDVAGKTVCFVDEVSTSGRLYPLAGLMDAGVLPQGEEGVENEEEYIDPYLAGAHDNSVLAVLDGTCDAGFAYDNIVDEQMIAAGDLEEGQVKVVWESEDIPSSPFAASGNLPDDMIEAMREILIDYLNVEWLAENGYCEDTDTETGDCRHLVPTNDWGYTEATDSVFDGIRAVCEVTQATACEG